MQMSPTSCGYNLIPLYFLYTPWKPVVRCFQGLSKKISMKWVNEKLIFVTLEQMFETLNLLIDSCKNFWSSEWKWIAWINRIKQVYFNVKHLSTNPTKWLNTLKQFVGNLPTNCLSVFDHFVKLALKGLNTQ